MAFSIQSISLADVSWIYIIVYILHFAEEAPRLVNWFNRNKMPAKFHYTQAKLVTENIILFSYVSLTVILLNIFPGNPVLKIIVFSHSFGFIGNFFFHAMPTLRTGVYSPGVVSASSLFPILFAVIIIAVKFEGLINPFDLLCASAIGILNLPVALFLTHKIIFKNNSVLEK